MQHIDSLQSQSRHEFDSRVGDLEGTASLGGKRRVRQVDADALLLKSPEEAEAMLIGTRRSLMSLPTHDGDGGGGQVADEEHDDSVLDSGEEEEDHDEGAGDHGRQDSLSVARTRPVERVHTAPSGKHKWKGSVTKLQAISRFKAKAGGEQLYGRDARDNSVSVSDASSLRESGVGEGAGGATGGGEGGDAAASAGGDAAGSETVEKAPTRTKSAKKSRSRSKRKKKKLRTAELGAAWDDPYNTYVRRERLSKEKTPVGVLHPLSLLMRVWGVVVLVLLLYVATLTPVRVSFWDNDVAPDAVIILEYVMDGLFLIDIIINFNAAYYNEREQLVTDRKRIFSQYFFGWFWLDLVATFPFYLVDSGEYNRSVRLLRLPRLAKLLRVVRILRVMRLRKWVALLVNRLQLSNAGLRLLRFLMWMLVLVHVTACGWFFVAKEEGLDGSWVARAGLVNASRGTQYVASVYWALSTVTTVGYGDISAESTGEYCVSLVCMVIGVSFYSFTIGNMQSILAGVDSKAARRRKEMDNLNRFIRENKLPPELAEQLRTFFRFHVRDGAVLSQADRSHVLQTMSASLRNEVLLFIHRELVESIGFFNDKRPEFVAHVTSLLKRIPYSAGDYIYREGAAADGIYFLLRGRAHALRSQEYTGPVAMRRKSINALVQQQLGAQAEDAETAREIPVRGLVQGCYFGDIELVLGVTRAYSVRAIANCEVMMLPKRDVFHIMKEYPDIGHYLREVAHEKARRWDVSLDDAIQREIMRRASSGKLVPVPKPRLQPPRLHITRNPVVPEHDACTGSIVIPASPRTPPSRGRAGSAVMGDSTPAFVSTEESDRKREEASVRERRISDAEEDLQELTSGSGLGSLKGSQVRDALGKDEGVGVDKEQVQSIGVSLQRLETLVQHVSVGQQRQRRKMLELKAMVDMSLQQ